MSVDVWRMIAAERASLVRALAKLDDDDWSRPTLCADWSVREVVGHLVVTATVGRVVFMAGMIANGFRRGSLAQGGVRLITAGRTNAQLLAALRSRVDARSAPPGPALTWLGEAIVHGEDIFRARGAYREHPMRHVLAVADFYSSSNQLVKARRRIAGLSLCASDAYWRSGQGPQVTGPAIAILMAMAGRATALDDLTGPGVPVLRARLNAPRPR